MAPTRPPFAITGAILASVGRIERQLGRLDGLQRPAPAPALRRTIAVRTVVATLAIEGESVRGDQVTAILDGKRVVGPAHELTAARNALAAYAMAPRLRPERERDLLAAHAALMKGLVDDAGKYRRGNVGVVTEGRVTHVAPKAERVPHLVRDLLAWLRLDAEVDPMIRSAVAHYELELIHPFSDGNGRMGRLWQHVLLVKADPVFAHVPVEAIVRDRQEAYYAALSASDRAGASTPFVELSLATVADALDELVAALEPTRLDAAARLGRAQEALGERTFSRAEYAALLQPLSGATASRDLAAGVDRGLLDRQGDKATARYRFRRAR